MARPLLAALPLLLSLGACVGLETSARHTLDPVVVVHGPVSDELGVSTDYGIVFLGRGAKSGRVEFTVWYGDGPSREEGLVESVGNGLYATTSEILVPCVALCFTPPPAGTQVIVRGRRGGEPYELEGELAADPHVDGVILRSSPELSSLSEADLGAGVFFVDPGKPLQLIGLVSGRVEIEGLRYYTVVGPDDLWRLVVHRRNSDRPRRWVYREDIL